jgi:hypothetical protein
LLSDYLEKTMGALALLTAGAHLFWLERNARGQLACGANKNGADIRDTGPAVTT